MMKYALNPQDISDSGVKARKESAQETPYRDSFSDNLMNDVCLHMRSQIYSSIESAGSILEFQQARMLPSVEPHIINLKNERFFIFRNCGDSALDVFRVNNSDRERYLKRPST